MADESCAAGSGSGDTTTESTALVRGARAGSRRYVGTRAGVEWWCNAGEDFEEMCRAFDGTAAELENPAVERFVRDPMNRVSADDAAFLFSIIAPGADEELASAMIPVLLERRRGLPMSAKNEAGPKRGDRVDGGVYIGERNGVKWIAYRSENVATMIEAFDAGPDAELHSRYVEACGESELVVAEAETWFSWLARREDGELPAAAHERTTPEVEQYEALRQLRRASLDTLSRHWIRSKVARRVVVRSNISHGGWRGGQITMRVPTVNGSRRRSAIDRAIERAFRIRDCRIDVTRDVRFLRGVMHVVRSQIGVMSWMGILSHFNMKLDINLAPFGPGGSNLHHQGRLEVAVSTSDYESKDWINDIACAAARYISDRIGANLGRNYAHFHAMLALALFDLDAITDDYMNHPLLAFTTREAA